MRNQASQLVPVRQARGMHTSLWHRMSKLAADGTTGRPKAALRQYPLMADTGQPMSSRPPTATAAIPSSPFA
jgi:hypothetical protein